MVVEFRHKKETKGTQVYDEIEGPAGILIGTIYIKKHAALALGNPAEIVVTVEAKT